MNGVSGGSGLQVVVRQFTMYFCVLVTKREVGIHVRETQVAH